MTAIVVVGTQWGDEGKGKITDFLSQQADAIVRYQGGDNAGHTIATAGQTYKLRLIPSGILYPDKLSVLGNGMVINPESLIHELQQLKDQHVATNRLIISDRAHVILPYHLVLDRLQEAQRGQGQIGTTHRGIGPAYMDKAERIGIRMADLLDREVFAAKLQANLTLKNQLIERLYHGQPLLFEDIFETYYHYGQLLKAYVEDASVTINQQLDQQHRVLFEGAQGVMLDLDQGTYPYVTSSHPAGGMTIGAGVGAPRIDRVVGVCKAYTSRVGDGPFPTEQLNATGDALRTAGHEYGTVTKRPRRIGWFDAVVVNHAKRVAGVSDLCLNCLDVLTGLPELKICVGYQVGTQILTHYPASLTTLAQAQPVYETLPGWQEDISQVTHFEQLPLAAQHYVQRISELIGVRLITLSVGPDRHQTLVLKNLWSD